jgi:sensor histidine kinase YesM
VTDIPNHDHFWPHSVRQHLIALAVLILLSYWFDYQIRRSVNQKWFVQKSYFDMVKEYGIVILRQLLGINLILYLGEKTGVLYLGNHITDYIIANVVCIPIFTLYYTAVNREKIEEEYKEQALLLGKIRTTDLENELKALRAQYHPHFLFNALNTVYFQIDSENKAAKQTVEMLSDLLRYQLYDINQEVTIGQEINYLNTYIEFQKHRMPDYLKLQWDWNIQTQERKIQPLLFQPLLENAFKYTGGSYQMDIEMKQIENQLAFKVTNSVPENEIIHSEKGGIGLSNLKRRLDLLYPDKYVLKTEQKENLFCVILSLELT